MKIKYLIIIFLLVINCNVFSQDFIVCEDDYIKNIYSYKQFEITECNCRCTIQENIFFIHNSESNTIIKLLGASKIMVNDSDIREDGPEMEYFMRSKKSCIEGIVLEEEALNFFTLVPRDDNQPCYEYSAYIDSTGNLKILEDYVTAQIIKTIVSSKQFLYDGQSDSTRTKMYLIKGDKVEVLRDEGAWLYVLYKGNKEIKKWIPQTAVE